MSAPPTRATPLLSPQPPASTQETYANANTAPPAAASLTPTPTKTKTTHLWTTYAPEVAPSKDVNYVEPPLPALPNTDGSNSIPPTRRPRPTLRLEQSPATYPSSLHTPALLSPRTVSSSPSPNSTFNDSISRYGQRSPCATAEAGPTPCESVNSSGITVYSSATEPIANRSSVTTGSRTFGFLGSLSPKSSRLKVGKQSKADSIQRLNISPSPTPSSTPVSTSTSPLHSASTHLTEQDRSPTVGHSSHSSSSGSLRKTSTERQEPPFVQQLIKENDRIRRSKHKDRHHPNLGHRFSKAIGLSSVTSSSKRKDHQQRVRQVSGGNCSLSTIDNIQQHATDESFSTGATTIGNYEMDKNREKDKDRSKRSTGIMHHFKIRSRVLSTSDVHMSRYPTFIPSLDPVSGSELRYEPHGRVTSISAPSPSANVSAVNSDMSGESEHRTEEEEENGPMGSYVAVAKRGHGRGNSSSSVLDAHSVAQQQERARHFQHRHSEVFSTSALDIMELTKGLHPHDMPGDENLASQAHTQSTDNEHTDVSRRNLFNLKAKRSTHLDGSLNLLNMSVSTANLADLEPVHGTGSAKSSSRLSRLSRFKLPSISMTNIHRSKSWGNRSMSQQDRSKSSSHIHLEQTKDALSSVIPVPQLPYIPCTISDKDAKTEHDLKAITRFGSGISLELGERSVSMDDAIQRHFDSDYSRPKRNEESKRKLSHPTFQSEPPSRTHRRGLSTAPSTPSAHKTETEMRRASEELMAAQLLHRSPISKNSQALDPELLTKRSSGHASSNERPGQQGIRSTLFKRSSRRTLSASHISTEGIFILDVETPPHPALPKNILEIEKGLLGGCPESTLASPPSADTQLLKGERGIYTTVKQRCSIDESEAPASQQTSSGERPHRLDGTVGKYLFGNDLNNLFGLNETQSTLALDDDEPTPISRPPLEKKILLGAEFLEPEATIALPMKPDHPHSVEMSITQEPFTASPVPMEKSYLKKAAVSSILHPLTKKRSNPSFFSSTRNSGCGYPNSNGNSSKSSNDVFSYVNGAYSHSSLSVGASEKALATLDSPSMQAAAPSTVGSSMSLNSFRPRSPATVPKDHRDRKQSSSTANSSAPVTPTSSSSAYSPAPVSSHHPPSSSSSVIAAAKSKLSLSSLSHGGSMGLSSVSSVFGQGSSGKHSSSHQHTTKTLEGGASANSKHSTSSESGRRSTNVLHLEPRSAVVDNTSTINFRRQRSMSLQDADLLTADQFIALLPDDTPKRRFSSEETHTENNGRGNQPNSKLVSLPDPPTTLHSLLEALRSRCGTLLKHLSAISGAPIPTFDGMMTALDNSSKAEATTDSLTTSTTTNESLSTKPSSLSSRTLVTDSADLSGPQAMEYKSLQQISPEEQTHRTHQSKYQGHAQQVTADINLETLENGENPELEETIATIFDDLDHILSKILDIVQKYIPAYQLAKTLKESDEMCFLTQEISRVETERRRKRTGEQSALMSDLITRSNQSEISADNNHVFNESTQTQQRQRDEAAVTLFPAAPTKETLSREGPRKENGPISRTNGGFIVKKESRERIRRRRSRNYYKHECRPLDGYSDPSKIEPPASPLSTKHEEQISAVIDYVRNVPKTAEECILEFICVYNKLFVVPTTGYRVEGYNDLQKVESTVSKFDYSVHPLTVGHQQSSLLGKVEVVQARKDSMEYLTEDGSTVNPSHSIEPPYPSSSSSISIASHPMSRVKSMPESRNEWAVLQKKKEMGNSVGVGGAITMAFAPPTGMVGGIEEIVATGARSGNCSELLTPNDYSKEHMGHEAYYYRNWFLGKEHRTFVGPIDGMGNVIISIIKDIVVPLDSRATTIPRVNTCSTTSSSFGTSSTSYGSISSGTSTQSEHNQSYSTHTRRFTHFGGDGSSSIAAPRSSSEAMRVILSSSNHGSGSAPNSRSASHGSTKASATTTSSHHEIPTFAMIDSNSFNSNRSNSYSGSTALTNVTPRWQYRCILRQKDVDSIRITFPEPDPTPLNNLTRRAGKPQWKTILQSIHPAITQQVASKLKKVQANPQFEKELAKFDETMLRFNYKFGVLLVRPGQTKEEEWFGNQMSSSSRFQEFLESGVLGQKVALKGFDRFSAGLDTRFGETGDLSYYDTWGEGFQIMYHVSTLLPHNPIDRQQIQRKRHIGNDIVCVVFVDGDQPFIPNTIKSQFLHIFVVIHPISLPDGTRAYSAAVACDEQVPEFGPPLPDPPIFRSSVELRAFLLCKMINGENAAYKAPRLVKPHQRARSGMLGNLVTKAEGLTKDKDIEKINSKLTKQKIAAIAALSSASMAGTSNPGSSLSSTLFPSNSNNQQQKNTAQTPHYFSPINGKDSQGFGTPPEYSENSNANPYHASPSHSFLGNRKASTVAGTRSGARTSLVTIGSETAASLFKTKRRNSNADVAKIDACFNAGTITTREKEKGRQSRSICGEKLDERIPRRQQQSKEQLELGHKELCLQTDIQRVTSPFEAPAENYSYAADGDPFFRMEGSSYARQDRCCSRNCCGNCCCSTGSCGGTPLPSSSAFPHLQGPDYRFLSLSTASLPIIQPERSKTAGPNWSESSHSNYPSEGVHPHRPQSATSSPTENRFPRDFTGPSNMYHYHSPMPIAASTSNGIPGVLGHIGGSVDSPGIDSTSYQGQSRSDLDLQLATIRETHASAKKSPSITPTTNSSSSFFPAQRAEYAPGEDQEANHGTRMASSSTTTPEPFPYGYCDMQVPMCFPAGVKLGASSSSSTSTATMSHPTMKGRAQNFLTTLVRRRASSNDMSTLSPIHHFSDSARLAGSSTLGSWATFGLERTKFDNSPQHFSPANQHCCTSRHQHALSPPSHSGQTIQPQPSTQETPLASAPSSMKGLSLKFKEGFNKAKSPMFINTTTLLPHNHHCPNVSQYPAPLGVSSPRRSSYAGPLPFSPSGLGPSGLRSTSGLNLQSCLSRSCSSTNVMLSTSIPASSVSTTVSPTAPVGNALPMTRRSMPNASKELSTMGLLFPSSVVTTPPSSRIHSYDLLATATAAQNTDHHVSGCGYNHNSFALGSPGGWRLSESPVPFTPPLSSSTATNELASPPLTNGSLDSRCSLQSMGPNSVLPSPSELHAVRGFANDGAAPTAAYHHDYLTHKSFSPRQQLGPLDLESTVSKGAATSVKGSRLGEFMPMYETTPGGMRLMSTQNTTVDSRKETMVGAEPRERTDLKARPYLGRRASSPDIKCYFQESQTEIVDLVQEIESLDVKENV